MKYAVDEIINDKVVLEEINSGKIIYVSLSDLPLNIRETDIVMHDGTKYVLDSLTKEARLEKIRLKMEKLKNNKDIF